MDGTFVDMNDSGLELFGIDRRSLSKITASDIYAAPFDRDTVTDKIIKEGFVKSYESSMRKMDGTTFPATITSTAIKNSAGEITGFQGIIRDETDRKRAEEKIRRSLREKEALLAEIHHRVKNNMQIISSLLSLQSRDIKDEKALSLIKNCEDRIISMSLVHEKLYLSEDLSRIDFGNYITSITAMLFQSYRVDSRIVNFTTHIEDAFFGVETAIPLGLIVNELISNAMKHAFPNNRRGDLTVELARSDKADTYKLTVTDDGVGLPYGIDYKNTKTFGIQLIYMLTEQLNGEVGFESDSKTGTSFKITFREQKPRMEI
jgi:PAS domain S-box-containing protein